MKENCGGRNVHGPAVTNPLTRQLPHVRLSDREVLISGWVAHGDTVARSAEARPVNATRVRTSRAGMGEIAVSPRPRP
jgi:hypothetical protein